MVSYRITKFNPAKRDKNGFYTDHSEWTAISDINQPNHSVNYKEYEQVENAYVETVYLVLKEKGIEKLTVNSLYDQISEKEFENEKNEIRYKNLNVNYKNEINPLKNDYQIGLSQVDKFVRLILREIIWFILVDTNIEIEFGYDYYMYIVCEKLTKDTVDQIESLGLFVESNIERPKVIEYDEDGNEIE